ncbi:MAG TPA: dihydrodipicolinate reductase [Armatimonadota bacterium]
MINVVQVGLGPLGQKIVRFAQERNGIKIVAAVDPASDKAGKDLGELCGIAKLGIVVSPDLKTALQGVKVDAAVLTTVSSVVKLESQVAELAAAKLNIVSTCEELSFPWWTQPEVSKRIDEVCKANGVACLGTGVNPGFLMDFLPTALTAVCQKVDKIKVSRVQDASSRRIPFQQKIGAGLTPAQFQEKVAVGTLRHVGLTESMHMIAARMGWKLTRTDESLDPVIADSEIVSGYTAIKPGMARGVHQVGRGFVGGEEVITLDFLAAVGENESYDRVEITGDPNIVSNIAGGVNGDIATCAITLNGVYAIGKAPKGLRTMVDMPVVAYSAE